MLRLPRFAVEVPGSIAAATAALASPGARVIAGGTDILPNLKHRLDAPPLLVSLARLDELRGIRLESATLVLGAGVTLAEIAESPLVGEHAPSLARAAGLVASPLIRNMGTLGGNINLDTRCRYVNQTDFWRSAIGGCLKSEGAVCHVVPKGKSCVAAMSADCVPVLCTLEAELVQVSAAGERRVAIADHYKSDGVDHITAPAGELTSAVRVPLARGRRQAAYAKWAVRESIDFPLVSVAMRFDLDRAGAIEAASVVLGVMAARPKPVKVESLVGRRLEDASTLESLVEQLRKQARPLGNVPYDADYRRRVIPVFARRALEAAMRA